MIRVSASESRCDCLTSWTLRLARLHPALAAGPLIRMSLSSGHPSRQHVPHQLLVSPPLPDHTTTFCCDSSFTHSSCCSYAAAASRSTLRSVGGPCSESKVWMAALPRSASRTIPRPMCSAHTWRARGTRTREGEKTWRAQAASDLCRSLRRNAYARGQHALSHSISPRRGGDSREARAPAPAMRLPHYDTHLVAQLIRMDPIGRPAAPILPAIVIARVT